MFLKNWMIASKSIHVRIAFIASFAVTTSAECVVVKKTAAVGNLVVNKHILCFFFIPA
jgi:hypothetical protein